jgi:hypothetical protein
MLLEEEAQTVEHRPLDDLDLCSNGVEWSSPSDHSAEPLRRPTLHSLLQGIHQD